MHVGRDIVLPIAMNHTNSNKHVSPAYSVFSLKNEGKVYRDFFFMLFKSTEKDRFFWFQTDASVRQGLSWEDFCNIEFEFPSLDVQKKYVAVYQSAQENLAAYQSNLDNLKLVCDGYIDQIKHISPRIKISEILEFVDERNVDSTIIEVQGINITKDFMPSVVSVEEQNVHNYKIVRKGQFAFSGMQTGRDKCIRIALNYKEEPIIVSPAYTTLRIKNIDVDAEYIMLWFSRKESDRYGWFASDGSVRSNLDLDRFFDIEIPLPQIDIQQDIVNIYKAYIERGRIVEKMKESIKTMCPVLIKGSLEEAPTDSTDKHRKNNPYKSE